MALYIKAFLRYFLFGSGVEKRTEVAGPRAGI